MLALVAAGLAGAFWFSLFSSTAGGLDTPLGLAPAAVPLAAWAGYLALRRSGFADSPRDAMLDGAVGGLLLLAALWLVWLQPDSLGWRYWAERRDLLAFELFALGAACWLVGLSTVWRARPALLVLLLGSPSVLLWLQERLAGPLALFTAGAARLITTGLGAHFAASPDPTVFRGISDAGVPFSIIIADVCSGLSSWVTILLMTVPVALYLGLGVLGALMWAAAGLALASAANVLRVGVLLVLAQRADPSFALGVVHPILGAVLLFGVVALLVFGVEGIPLPAGRPSMAISRQRGWVFLGAVALAGAGQVRLLPFQQLPAGGPPGPAVNEALAILPQLPGWQTELVEELGWQNLFGPASHSYLVNYRSDSGLEVTTQVVTTPDLRRLLTYTPDQCGVYHGQDMKGQTTVDLGLGQVGFLVNSTDRVPIDRLHPEAGLRPLDFNILYWYVPFSLHGESWNARILLILDGDAADQVPDALAGNRGLSPGGAEFEKVDSELLTLGRQMISSLGAA